MDINYIVFENNIGNESLTAQWERCLDLVKGEEWVMILCDDDVLGENCIKSFYDNYEAVTKSGSKLVRFASMEIDENSHKTSGLFNIQISNLQVIRIAENYLELQEVH